MHVFPIRTQIDDRIANDLAQAVICDFAATVRFKDGDAACSQDRLWRDDSILRRAPA